jgi:hypothetical protein
MPNRADWRSSSAADNVNQLDRAGIAWEFLRRNPQYREDYRRIPRGAASTDPVAAAVGEPWGLSFRLRPQPAGASRSGDLATGDSAPQRHPRPGAG